MSEGDLLHIVATDHIGPARRAFGLALIWGSPLVLALVALAQVMQTWGGYDFGFANCGPRFTPMCSMPSACVGVRSW